MSRLLHRKPKLSKVLALSAVVLLFAAIPACGGDDTADTTDTTDENAAPTEQLQPIQELSIDVSKSGTELSEPQLEAGPVEITVNNAGDKPFQLGVAKLNEGVTQKQVEAAIKNNDERKIFSLLTLAGSTQEPAKPGGTATTTIEFPEGEYIALDPEAGAPPAYFNVGPAAGEYEIPTSDAQVEEGDFYIEMGDLPPGEVTLEISNVGQQAHELVLLRKVKGGEPEDAGFTLAPAPGARMWATFDLKPGEYQAVCYFPDPESGKPHVKLGMKTDFTVQ